MPRNDDERLSVVEVAGRLGVSERTARRLIDSGELVAYRITPRTAWVRTEDLKEFLETRKTSR